MDAYMRAEQSASPGRDFADPRERELATGFAFCERHADRLNVTACHSQAS